MTGAALQQGLGLLQTGIGALQSIGANNKLKKLSNELTPYKTPKEAYDILYGSQYYAQTGFSDATMNYLTGNAERGFSNSAEAIVQMGGDPNMIAAINDQYMNQIMKIGSDNEILRMRNFDRYQDSLKMISDNLGAEWQSKQNLIKDKMQAAYQKSQAGQANMQSGVNAFLSGRAAQESSKMWDSELGYPQGTNRVYNTPAEGSFAGFTQLSALLPRRTPNVNLPNPPFLDSTLSGGGLSAGYGGSVGR